MLSGKGLHTLAAMTVKGCCADEEWQSTPKSTPRLMQSKPPRITPPPLLNLQAKAQCGPSAPDTLLEGLSSVPEQSKRPDADVASPSGRCGSGSQPVPCCSPEIKRIGFRQQQSPHAKASSESKLCISAESQLEHLPPAVPSTTPTLPRVLLRRQNARCMQCSGDQSTIRPFPDLDVESEASDEAMPSAPSQVARYWGTTCQQLAIAALAPLLIHVHNNALLSAWTCSTYAEATLSGLMLLVEYRLDDVMECSPTDSLPQRQHWSRQSLCQPLTAFAAQSEEVLQNVSACQGMDSSQSACCSPTQCFLYHQPDTRQCPRNMPIVFEGAQMLEVPDVSTTRNSIQQRALENLDRSCSAMSLG